MQNRIIVAAHESATGEWAFARAQQVGGPVLVLVDEHRDDTERWTGGGAAFEPVPRADDTAVMDAAATHEATFTILQGRRAAALQYFRNRLMAEQALGWSARQEFAGLLMPPADVMGASSVWEKVIVGYDASMGGVMAVLAAAHVAEHCGAELHVVVAERRGDDTARARFEYLKATDPHFDAEAFRDEWRRVHAIPGVDLRELLAEFGIPVQWRQEDGEAADVLAQVSASAPGSTLVVTGASGTASRGRQGRAGHVPTTLLKYSAAEQLVVYDAVSLGFEGQPGPDMIASHARELLCVS